MTVGPRACRRRTESASNCVAPAARGCRPELAADFDRRPVGRGGWGRGLAEAPGLDVDPAAVESNIVVFDVADGAADAFSRRAATAGVLVSSVGPASVRAVTHLDVDRAAIERAVAVLSVAV